MSLRVLLIDAEPDRAEAVSAGLRADGCTVVGIVPDPLDLVAQVRSAAAEVIVCDLDHPSRDAIESARILHRDEPRPVVMFVDRSDPESLRAAMRAGVAAYVIEGLSPNRVKAVIDVAVARFSEYQALRTELEAARLALRERKLVERAKGVLMHTRHISEPEAHRTLQRLAMEQGKRLPDIAESVVTLAKVLKR